MKFLLSRFGLLPEIGKVCHWLTTRVGVATFAKQPRKLSGAAKEADWVKVQAMNLRPARALRREAKRTTGPRFGVPSKAMTQKSTPQLSQRIARGKGSAAVEGETSAVACRYGRLGAVWC